MKLAEFSIPGGPEPGSTSMPLAIPTGIPVGGLQTSGMALIHVALGWFLYIGITIAVVVTIFSGIQWIMSRGDAIKIAEIRRRIFFIVIGVVLIVLAYFIMNLVVKILGGDANTILNPNP